MAETRIHSSTALLGRPLAAQTQNDPLDALARKVAMKREILPGAGVSSPSLVGRVTLPPTTETVMEKLSEEIQAIPAEKLKEIEADRNYLNRIYELTGKILLQFIRIGEKERFQKEELKAKFKSSNAESGELQEEMGNRGVYFSVVAAGLIGVQAFSGGWNQELVDYFSGKGCENLANMFNASTQSKQKRVDGVASLAQGDLGALQNKAGDQNKDLFIRMLDELSNLIKSAARGQ